MMYLVTLAAIVLLPIVPAYLLFKALPSTAAVSGPLKGLELKLGGAFAGYFALVILILYSRPIWNPPPAYEWWSVTGKAINKISGKPIEPLKPADFEMTRPCYRLDPEGSFTLYFAPLPSVSGGLDYPKLVINPSDFEKVTIDLDPDRRDPHVINRDKLKRYIDLGNLELIRLQPYSPQGSPPAPSQEPHQ